MTEEAELVGGGFLGCTRSCCSWWWTGPPPPFLPEASAVPKWAILMLAPLYLYGVALGGFLLEPETSESESESEQSSDEEAVIDVLSSLVLLSAEQEEGEGEEEEEGNYIEIAGVCECHMPCTAQRRVQWACRHPVAVGSRCHAAAA